MRLHLIRHGMTEANEKKLYCGSTDISLSAKGVKELAELRECGGYPAPRGCRLITSGMERTEETFRLLYGALAHERVSDLREINFGDFEMLSYDELKDRPDYQEWVSGDNYTKRCPNGESGAETDMRAQRVLEELTSAERDVIIITHGGVISGIMAKLFPQKEKNRYDWQPEPGTGYTVTFHNGRPAMYYKIPVR